MSDFRNRIIEVKEVDPNTIKYNPGNYRVHPDIQKSMMGGVLDEVGWIQSVIVNKNTGNIIDGHMRVEIARERREPTIPVVFVDLTEEEEKKALASFDPISTFAKEDRDRLTELMQSVETHNAEMRDLVDRIAKKRKINLNEDDEDAFDERDKRREEKFERENKEREASVKRWGVEEGQLWKIPSKALNDQYHVLMCGDSTQPENVLKLTDQRIANLMVTDPPYGIDFEDKFNPKSKDWNPIMNDSLKGESLRKWLADTIKIWSDHMMDDSAYYIWSPVFEEGFAIYHAIHDAGLHVQSQIVWSKNAFSLGQTDYHWQHEICWYAFRTGSKHKWYGGRDQSSVWNVHKVPNSQYIHPMQKPTELYTIPIKNHTKVGDLILDPFVGCGTCIVASEDNGRICYGMENDPMWVAASLDRFEKFGLRPELM